MTLAEKLDTILVEFSTQAWAGDTLSTTRARTQILDLIAAEMDYVLGDPLPTIGLSNSLHETENTQKNQLLRQQRERLRERLGRKFPGEA